MSCRSCGAALEGTAQYCSQCGARVELGALLGVGTAVDAAPVDPDVETEVERDRRPFPLGRALAMVATFLVLTVIGALALTRIFGSGGPEQASAASSAQASQTEEEAGDTASSAQAPSQTPSGGAASPTSTPSPTPTPSSPSPTPVQIPAGARLCSTAGTDAVASAYAGTERTSCEFSESVRTAYRDEGTPDGEASLRVRSPVTKKWYSLTCDGGTPVRCVTTTGAVVYLAPAGN
ncbi:hypothetical protein BCF74_11150 [Knoellia remsis]|uniref:Zinc ribbon protein n=1 Tax=Knoellia remsis TaxID=407159 RepID=A0A2T0ULF5_9MICO|nr:zinc ribbon domain-containing protein [Knoellia remsis]PRY58769.1 hypothetical protein BCF74_11150 [Knoellia remsis]